ncbi:Ig-like domain-containing protein [Lachnospiraceae bacterium KK002]
MKKKFLSKKHMAVLLSAVLAAGSLSFVPAEYAGLSMVYAEESTEETATPAFAEDNPEIMASGDKGTLKITGLKAGSTVTWTSDNKAVIDFETEGAEEEQAETEEATADTTVTDGATETTVKVKAGVAGEANISATVKEASEEQKTGAGGSPLTCKITVNFKLDGVTDGNVNLDLKENKTAEITVSGVADGTELEWTSALPAKEEEPENPDENEEGSENQPEAPKPEDVATVTSAENDTTKATITAVAVGEINVTVAVKEEAEGQADEARTESWKQQTFTVKVTEGQTEEPTPEQPTPEQPTPEQPTPEQPTPEQPTPEQPGGGTSTNTPVAVSGISLSQTTITLDKGKTAALTATVAPENATDKTVIWSSSNEKVATVSNGTVTAVAKGTATITAKAGDKTATCTVTVKVPASKVTLNTKQIYMVKGKSVNVKATVTPSDTTDKTSWSTSNKKVATVKNGKISARKTGKATCKITVK